MEAEVGVIQRHTIVYAVHEIDSALELETIREKAIAEYEQKHGLEVDEQNVDFIQLVICYANKKAEV